MATGPVPEVVGVVVLLGAVLLGAAPWSPLLQPDIKTTAAAADETANAAARYECFTARYIPDVNARKLLLGDVTDVYRACDPQKVPVRRVSGTRSPAQSQTQ